MSCYSLGLLKACCMQNAIAKKKQNEPERQKEIFFFFVTNSDRHSTSLDIELNNLIATLAIVCQQVMDRK